MKLKTAVIYGIVVVVALFFSEFVNYLSDPASSSSTAVNNLLIDKAIEKARVGDFESSFNYLTWASRINTFGEYGLYQRNLPGDYHKKTQIPEDDGLRNNLGKYIASLERKDIKLPEDQGLGRIYYNLALIAFKSGYGDLSSQFLRTAMYNNPEFASFHAELINLYFIQGDMQKVQNELDYCLNFKWSITLCEAYKADSLKINIPKPVGYMSDEVDRHYLR